MDSATIILIVFVVLMLFCCGGMMRSRKSCESGKDRNEEDRK